MEETIGIVTIYMISQDNVIDIHSLRFQLEREFRVIHLILEDLTNEIKLCK